MHELALARSMIDLVEEHARLHGSMNVQKISIRMGELSAMSRALHFCFSAAAKNTLCEGAILEIDEIPLTVYCATCEEKKSPLGKYSFRCSDCGSPTPEIVTGKELELISIELCDERFTGGNTASSEQSRQIRERAFFHG